MISRWLIGLSASLVLLVGVLGCKPSTSSWEAMVAFDRAYIPALAFTSQQDRKQARQVMPALVTQWQSMQKQVPSAWRTEGLWRKDAEDITRRITSAQALVTGEGNLIDAHEELEGIRLLLMARRRQHGIVYFVDYLTAFHHPMETIVLTAKGKTPETLTDTDITVIQQQLKEARHLWTQVEQVGFNAARYQFSAERAADLRDGITGESAALRTLQEALQAGDRRQIIHRAVAIKPTFAHLFMLFGDFPSGAAPVT